MIVCMASTHSRLVAAGMMLMSQQYLNLEMNVAVVEKQNSGETHLGSYHPLEE